MPMTNQYLAFGTGVGANTLAYSIYAATLSSTINPGYATGVADAQHVNTVLRQATVGVAGLAKFATDYGTLNCLDDGSPANYALAVKSAVDARVAAGLPAALPSVSAMPGYIKFANGLILQWLSFHVGDPVPGGTTGAVTFPIAFPTACLTGQVQMMVPAVGGTGDMAVVILGTPAPSTTGLNWEVVEWSGTVQDLTLHIWAIGY